MEKALIDETANVLNNAPSGYDDSMAVNPPGMEWPRLRCYLFFKEDQDPTKSTFLRAIGWCQPHLQEVWYDLDKEWSSLAAKLTIPELLHEINIERDPQVAGETFKFMAEHPDASWALMDMEDAGDGYLSARDVERLTRLLEEQNRPGS